MLCSSPSIRRIPFHHFSSINYNFKCSIHSNHECSSCFVIHFFLFDSWLENCFSIIRTLGLNDEKNNDKTSKGTNQAHVRLYYRKQFVDAFLIIFTQEKEKRIKEKNLKKGKSTVCSVQCTWRPTTHGENKIPRNLNECNERS